jgi:glycosyltransferase involved in cell wall biosynthesis
VVAVTEAKARLGIARGLDEQPLIVIGIPAYNEERSIAKVVLQARKYADVVVVCDDGSSDMTGEIAEELGAVVLRHERNFGYGAAIQSLFREARRLGADVLVTLDGDGQHHVNDVSGLLQPVLCGEADVVTGSRFADGLENGGNHLPWYRELGIKAITKLTKSASRCDVSDAQNGFRAYNRQALERLGLEENGMGVSVEILVRAKELGLRLAEASVACDYKDVERPSTHNPLRHGASVITSLVRLVVEERPLMFLGLPGMLSLLLGALFGVWLLQIYTIEHRIVTNIALASIAFTMMGLFGVFTSITLYGISRVARKANSQERGE